MDKMEKYTGTVGNIISYRGQGEMPTHKVAKDVVSVLERMYKDEDENDTFLSEASDEAGIKHEDPKGEGKGGEEPVAAGSTDKIQPDAAKTDLSRAADAADGGALPNDKQKDAFKDTIQDKDRNVVESLFEDSDLDLPEKKEEKAPAKGSEEAKEKMAKLRAKKGGVKQPVEKAPVKEATGNITPPGQEAVAKMTNPGGGADDKKEPNHEAQGDPKRAVEVDNDTSDGAKGVGDRGLNEAGEEPDGDENGGEASADHVEPDGDEPEAEEPVEGEEWGEDEDEDEDLSLSSEPEAEEPAVEGEPPVAAVEPAVEGEPEDDIEAEMAAMEAEMEASEEPSVEPATEPMAENVKVKKVQGKVKTPVPAEKKTEKKDEKKEEKKDDKKPIKEGEVVPPAEAVPNKEEMAGEAAIEAPGTPQAPEEIPAGTTPPEKPLDVDAKTEGCEGCEEEVSLEELMELDDMDAVTPAPQTPVPTPTTQMPPAPKVPPMPPKPAPKMENVIVARKNTEEKIVEKLIREMEEMGKSEEEAPESAEDSLDMESLLDSSDEE